MPSRDVLRFQVGDKVIYPSQGVTQVAAIEERQIGGHTQSFYVLQPLDSDRKILVPVKSAPSVGLRPPMNRKQAREIFEILKADRKKPNGETWNRRYRAFMDKIKTGSIFDAAEVMRDLYRQRSEKSLSYGEKQLLETARTLVVTEMAIACNQPEQQVQNEVENIFT